MFAAYAASQAGMSGRYSSLFAQSTDAAIASSPMMLATRALL